MTLDQLRIFLVVADLQHITNAAGILNRSQAAVSAAISTLEKRHDVRLFNRIGRDIELTPDGRRFVAIAREVVEAADRAAAVLSGFSGTPAGPLRIAASQTVASYWLPPLIAGFQKTYPDVRPSLLTTNTERATERVVSGRADVGIVEGRVRNDALEITEVASDRLAVIVAPTHPWADGRPVSLGDIETGPWVMREQGSGTRAAFEDELTRRGANLSALRNALVMPSNEACLAAVSSGGLATVTSLLAAGPHLDSGALRMANFDMQDRAFLALCHAQRHPSRAALAFLTAIGAPRLKA